MFVSIKLTTTCPSMLAFGLSTLIHFEFGNEPSRIKRELPIEGDCSSRISGRLWLFWNNFKILIIWAIYWNLVKNRERQTQNLNKAKCIILGTIVYWYHTFLVRSTRRKLNFFIFVICCDSVPKLNYVLFYEGTL